jgi:hypothetical protein
MAVVRVIVAKVAFIGDGAATTYALNTNTGVYELLENSPNSAPSIAMNGLPLGAATVTAINPLSGITQIGKIPYTVVFASPTATITFASAPPAGQLDYLTLGLVVP